MNNRLKLAVLLLSSTALLGAPSVALGQVAQRDAAQGDDSRLEEIVVTARRKTESLMSVPVAVSAVGSAQLERAGATDLGQIGRMAPQVSITHAESGTGAILSIRGIGTPALDSALEQSVVLLIDGIPGGRGQLVNLGFFDLDRVEVMKGPQALFFGKNASAGVIALTSKGPGTKLEGYVRAGYEFEAREKYGEAAIGGPLTDTLSARIAVRGSTMRGFVKNLASGYAAGADPFYSSAGWFGLGVGSNFSVPPADHWGNYKDELLGRLTVKFEPSSNFDATLKVSAGKVKSLGTSAQAYCASGVNPNSFGFPDLQQECKFDGKNAIGTVPTEVASHMGRYFPDDGEPFARDKAFIASLAMNYKLGDDLTLTSVTGFNDTRHHQLTPYSYTSLATVTFATVENGHSFTQEIRLVSDYDGPLNFSAGGYYENLDRTTKGDGIFLPLPPDPVTGRYDNTENSIKTSGTTSSLFAQLRWAPVEKIELAGGARYTHETRKSTLNELFTSPYAAAAFTGDPTAVFFQPVGTPIKGKFSASNWSPEVTLSYKPNADSLIYGAFKTGFKSGGISSPGFVLANLTADRTECVDPTSNKVCLLFDNEKSKGFEVGAKTYLANHTIRIELTGYTFKYSNLQVSSFNQATNSFYLQNAASARVKGVEFQAEWAPVQGLRLTTSASYNSAKYLAFPTGACTVSQTAAGCTAQDLSGQALTRAPKYTFMIGGSYDTPIGDAWNVGINADGNYSSSYQTIEDHDPVGIQKGFWLLDAGIRVYQPEQGFELALIGTNLANKYYKILGSSASSGAPDVFWTVTPRTRQIKLQGTYRF